MHGQILTNERAKLQKISLMLQITFNYHSHQLDDLQSISIAFLRDANADMHLSYILGATLFLNLLKTVP